MREGAWSIFSGGSSLELPSISGGHLDDGHGGTDAAVVVAGLVPRHPGEGLVPVVLAPVGDQVQAGRVGLLEPEQARLHGVGLGLGLPRRRPPLAAKEQRRPHNLDRDGQR